MIIINFKGYKTGVAGLKLAKEIEKLNKKMIIAVYFFDIDKISAKSKLRVYGQFVGNSIEEVRKRGAVGSLVNHSEHPLSFNKIEKIIVESKEKNFEIIVCASNLKQAEKIADLKNKPKIIAFEDPKLIGSGKSITNYESSEVWKFAKMMKRKKIIPLCGAGISSIEDVKKAYKLGCKGVLISRAIANSNSYKDFLRKLAKLK